MSPTHDMNLANQSGASFRSDLNNALSAILSNNSNASSPATTVAYMIWADTNNNKLKIRNSADSAWVELINLDGTIARDLTLTGASANIVFDKSDNALEFADNAKATFGNAADLTVSHDGSNSIINDSGAGELQLQRAGATILALDAGGLTITDPSGATRVKVVGYEGYSASIELTADEGDDNGDNWRLLAFYTDNTFRIQNDISGTLATKWTINTDGDVTQTGHLLIPDSHQLRLGGSSDLTIEHDGSNSIINDNGTGEFQLQRAGNTLLTLNSTGIEVKDPSGTARVTVTGADGTYSAQVFLAADNGDDNGDTWGLQSTASDNSFRITNDVSGGQSTKWLMDTSGNVLHYGDLDLPDTKKIKLGNADDLQLYHDSSESFIADEGTGGITISSGLISFKNQARDETLATMAVNGAVTAFYDNMERFITTNSGAKVSRNNDGDNVAFLVTNDSSDSSSDCIVRLTVGGTTQHTSIHFADSGDSDAGEIDYDHNNNHFTYRVSGTDRYRMTTGAINPVADDLRDLGLSTARFDDVRATNGTINTSDRNEKNTIVASDLGLDFINKLSPVSYKFNNKTRTHYGLIAQDIETVLGTLSKSATDFAGFCKDQITTKTEIDEDGHAKETTLETPFDRYGLRYTEFIAPMIKAIQELSAKVTALEGS